MRCVSYIYKAMSCTLYLSTQYVVHSIFLYSYILTPYLVILVARHLGHPKCFKIPTDNEVFTT